ncbi:uncharacterized protein BP01DRAFT_381394 [Aspergillus saccharolyticus JOP 1030-1]|uniref:Protein kinase domain-containing protein n=1 Tax=Aspergillus saccharolyticus JOP 1030-1 TaxID=1450539 RepID=A0A318ZHJ7_9EURO|nr:hypothetical protein BP01DRAFT_381394 [Aspergillus saccharolyticus JOP 1030-1]PYH46969.1 hypothetical protein BP01DRAFT_381394 [Aspergillus saccharolyticus JOP 1030-1]
MPNYVASRDYPARIEDIVKEQYRMIGKLGFGASSIVWLAREMNYRRYVTLKIYITSEPVGQQLDDELHMYKDIKADKNMFGKGDDSVFENFVEQVLQTPRPRKELDEKITCVSQKSKHTEDFQPDVYRAPEVIRRAPWTLRHKFFTDRGDFCAGIALP